MNREKLIDQLVLHEGLRHSAYRDSRGFLTIGIGRLIDSRAGGGITKDEAFYLLNHDIDNVFDDLDTTFPWWSALDDVRQRVLVDMCFNLGIRKLREFVNTLGAIREGRWGDAADGMMASLWARQVGDRAERLANMMRTGVDGDDLRGESD